MHELSVCRALVSQVAALAASRAATVCSVNVAVGPLAGIDPQLLAAAYPSASYGTAAQGSHLRIETRPVRVQCRACGIESAARPNDLACAVCGDWRTELVSGDEMLLLSVELALGNVAEHADV